MDSEVFAREVGRLIRKRRKALGLTQSMLSQMTGTSRRYLVSLELGESPGVRIDTLCRVFTALGMTISISVEEDDESAEQSERDRPSLLSEKRSADDKESYVHAFEHMVENLGRPIV